MATHIPPTLSPDAIDTLTELTLILTKFRAAQASARRDASAAAAVGGPSSSSSSSNPSHGPNSTNAPLISTPAPGAVTGTTPLPIPTSNPNPTTAGSFSAKDLPQATDNLKHKLQRARQAVLALPDMGRTITQQEKEIAELEERKRKQIAMLAKIRDEGLQFARLEQSRRDEEGERMVE